MVREITVAEITATVSRLLIEANHALPDDVIAALQRSIETEKSPVGRDVLGILLQNWLVASTQAIPLCQDTGAAVIFLKVGQDVRVTGGDLSEAVNSGVRQAYMAEYLRMSMVARPYSTRVNTGDNTPAMIHTEIVPGSSFEVTVLPKGGGAENTSRLATLTPSQGRQGIVDFVVGVVHEAGGNSCPPVIVGVGIGGTVETTMVLAKKALLREVGRRHPDHEHAELEQEILGRVNGLGIGPMGFGGTVTALAVNVEVLPCHIASLPVAVNLQCHSARHKTAVL
jgi:fumarate hydratase subunit alpha